MPPESTSSDLARIKAESSAWAVAHERGLTAEEQDQFLEWQLADPRHGEWLTKHQQGLQSLKQLEHWRPQHSTRPNPDLLAVPPKAKPLKLIHWLAPIGLAAAVALTAAWWISASRRAELSEPPIVRKILEDGSTIDLNHGADVEVTYSPERRDVRLLRGEATFKVAKNPDRPFIVTAAGVTFRAVGTAFNVNLQAKKVDLLVTEGRVQVDRPSSGVTNPETIAFPLVEAGHRTSVVLAEVSAPAVEAVPVAEMDRVLAWQPKQLEFSDTPLAQVAAEFNAENRLKIVIDDPSLASMPMGASLRSDNVEGFVRILETNFGLKAERRGDMIVIRRGP